MKQNKFDTLRLRLKKMQEKIEQVLDNTGIEAVIERTLWNFHKTNVYGYYQIQYRKAEDESGVSRVFYKIQTLDIKDEDIWNNTNYKYKILPIGREKVLILKCNKKKIYDFVNDRVFIRQFPVYSHKNSYWCNTYIARDALINIKKNLKYVIRDYIVAKDKRRLHFISKNL